MLGYLKKGNRAKFGGCMTVLGLLGSGRGRGGGSLERGGAPVCASPKTLRLSTLSQMVSLMLSILQLLFHYYDYCVYLY